MTDEDLFPSRRPIFWTNRTVAARMGSHHGQLVYGFLPTSAGTVRIRMRKSAVRDILHAVGYDRPAICRFYVRDGRAYIIPLTMPVPHKGGSRQ
ncbi:MAG: hypothetical protein ACLGXA_04530 [Acidobacteriota bacterium]